MRTCSSPAKRKMGQRRSRNCAAKNRDPSEVRGVSFLAAKATPKCPMNMTCTLTRCFLHPRADVKNAIPKDGIRFSSAEGLVRSGVGCSFLFDFFRADSHSIKRPVHE